MTIATISWLEAFQDDLNLLQSPFMESFSEWALVQKQIKQQCKVELNALEGMKLKREMDYLTHALGYSYKSSITQSNRYLPSLKKQDDLLLMVLYLNHLRRYVLMHAANFPVSNDTNQDLLLIQEDIREMEKRLAAYCEKEDIKHFIQGEANATGGKTLEEKIIFLFGWGNTDGMIDRLNTRNDPIIWERFYEIIEKNRSLQQKFGRFQQMIESFEEEFSNHDIPRRQKQIMKKNNVLLYDINHRVKAIFQKIREEFIICETEEEINFIKARALALLQKTEKQIEDIMEECLFVYFDNISSAGVNTININLFV